MDAQDQNLAIEVIKKVLVEGKEMATKLREILFSEEVCGGGSTDEPVEKILRSFNDALSILRSGRCCDRSVVGASGDEVISPQFEDSACDGGGDDRRSEDSGVSLKRPAGSKKVTKRGCYKRKKNSLSWTTISATTEDDRAWRKYGQKDILNSTHPRSYFRCTHKYDQGCKATKQVQKMEENSQMYRITYIGQHTCREKNQEISFNGDGTRGSNSMFKFGNSEIPIEQDDKGRVLAIKTESKEETQTCSELTDNVSSLDSVIWRDIMTFDESVGDDTLLGPAVLTSEVTSQSLDMEFLVDSIDFDQFDFTFLSD